MIETERLELFPLTLEQLKTMRTDIKKLEQELHMSYQGEALEGFIMEYLDEQIRVITEKPESLMYNAFCLMVRKEDRVEMGSLAFKGLPDENGEIEIGYGQAEQFEHHGYMTEAVGALCEWGLAQENVKHIIAETDLDGYASQRILERNGFKRYRFGDESWWRK